MNKKEISRTQYINDMKYMLISNGMSIRDIDWYIMMCFAKKDIPVRRLAKNRSFKNKGFKLFKKYHN